MAIPKTINLKTWRWRERDGHRKDAKFKNMEGERDGDDDNNDDDDEP